MHLTLTIEANSFEEIAYLFDFRPLDPRGGEPAAIKEVEPNDAPVFEEEEEAPAKKSRKSRKSAASAEDGAGSNGSTETSSAADASPSDEKVTFEDLRAAATPLMEAGRGKEIQEMLMAKFDGARAFGALKAEQYAQALAELQDLAA